MIIDSDVTEPIVELLNVLRNLFIDDAGDTPIDPRGDCSGGTAAAVDSTDITAFCCGGACCKNEDRFARGAGASPGIFSTRGNGANNPC